jgi:membrane-bound lytic murein transglycosylase MltF
MIAAQGYQESKFDQSMRSKAGAVGVMQLLPSTTRISAVGIERVESDVDRNIEAGDKLSASSDLHLPR